MAFHYRSGNDPAPIVTSIEPSAASPGELVTVRGVHFRDDASVAFDASVTAVQLSTPDAHVVRVPELPTGRVSVLATDSHGRTSTSGPCSRSSRRDRRASRECRPRRW
ncbi:MAG TPA: IPT/TIG domain-containing protein [Thermoanaerobaculia bacterium]|nr:IPT/TIG domain-containing protein [Thermoanaerobaculia bacterium]